MTVKRKDFQKTAAYIHQFLLKLDETPACAELRDALNLALLHMQKYFRWAQRRRDSEPKDRICDAGSLSNASLRGLSPMTPFIDSPDRTHWRWAELDTANYPAARSPSEAGPPAPLPPVLDACKIGDMGALIELHRANPGCIEESDCLGRSPLMYAAHHDQTEAAEWLLRTGAKPGVPAQDQSTPLHLASLSGNWRLTELLLHHGADPNARDAQGRTPLHWSVTTSTTECLKTLLRCGADPGARDSDEASASMWACRLDSVEHFGLLRRALLGDAGDGAGADERDSEGRAAVHWAVRRQEPLKCLGALISQDTGAIRDNSGRTAMLTAAEIGSLPACKMILDACGRDAADQADGDQRTAVHLATVGGHGEVLNYLLDQGAEIDAKDKAGATAWDYAKQRRLNYCKLILASHYRQRSRDQQHQQHPETQATCPVAVEFPMPRPPRAPPTARSKSPSSGRRRLKVAGTNGGGGGALGGISRESSLENDEAAAAAAAAAAVFPVDGGRRSSEPSWDRTGRLNWPDCESPCRAQSPTSRPPRPPPGSPDRRLIRGSQPPARKEPPRPRSTSEDESAEDADLPPPPGFQADGDDSDGDADDLAASGGSGGLAAPLDTAREPHPTPPTQPADSRRRQGPPQSQQQSAPKPSLPPAQLQPLPAAYKEATSAASTSGRRRGKKKRRGYASASASASAGFVQPLDGSSIIVERRQLTSHPSPPLPPPPPPLPPPPREFGDSRGQQPPGWNADPSPRAAAGSRRHLLLLGGDGAA